MNFTLSETQQEIVDLAAKFAQTEVAPYVDQDEANSYFRKELFPKFGAAGLIGVHSSPDYGGSGLGTLEYALALEQVAMVSSGYATSLSVTALPQKILEAAGTEEQKRKFIPGIISGEKIGCFCLTEAGSGSDAGSIRSSAVRQGDHYILNGVKQFITNGIYADLFIVMARTGGPGSKGISAFIVDRHSPGIRAGKIEKKMGMRVSPTMEVVFEAVKVPVENRIGGEGLGFETAKEALDSGRISIAAIANGLSIAALKRAIAYAKEREQFGKPIIANQGISFLLADMATELEASRLLVLQAAFLKDAGRPFKQAASMAKLKSTETCMKITTDAVQIFGGYGYMEEYVVERYMREAKMLQIVEGTSQIQRMVISKGLQ